MKEFKVYLNDINNIEAVAKKFNLELFFLEDGFGAGYVSDGKSLKNFATGSEVDLDNNIEKLNFNLLDKVNEFKFKVYLNDKKTLDFIAKKQNLKLFFLKEGVGKGYVSDGKNLRVFTEDSHVDLNSDINELIGYERPFKL